MTTDTSKVPADRDETARLLFSRLSETLLASTDSRLVLQRMAELVVPALGDWCAIDVRRDDGTFARLAVAHPDPEMVALAHELWRRYPPNSDDPAGMPAVVRTGKSELVAHIPAEALEAGARDAWHLDAIRRLGLSGASYIVVPIRRSTGVLGALSLVHAGSGRTYDAADLVLAEEFGRIAGVAVENARLFEDLTVAREQAEASERSVREFVDHLPNLAWTATSDGSVEFYNRQWYKYTGTHFEQMQGWGWAAVHDPEVLPRVEEQWSASLRSGEPFEMEFPLRAADGSFRWFLTRAVPLRDRDGRVVRWIGSSVDIDDIRAARALALEMLEQSRDTGQRLVELTDQLGDARARIAELEAENARLRTAS